jgi:hypothetical protein
MKDSFVRCKDGGGHVRDGETPGAAALHLVDGVSLLHPDEQVFAAMTEGWRAQQLARNLDVTTITQRLAAVRAFAAHADVYPWGGGRRCSTSGSVTYARYVG